MCRFETCQSTGEISKVTQGKRVSGGHCKVDYGSGGSGFLACASRESLRVHKESWQQWLSGFFIFNLPYELADDEKVLNWRYFSIRRFGVSAWRTGNPCGFTMKSWQQPLLGFNLWKRINIFMKNNSISSHWSVFLILVGSSYLVSAGWRKESHRKAYLLTLIMFGLGQ